MAALTMKTVDRTKPRTHKRKKRSANPCGFCGAQFTNPAQRKQHTARCPR